ncbi:hypothetical protein FEE95_12750 [Maribacter algarum]|uniref:Alpha-2-macroglobulin domain-containing protein n=1 Tax=Maribacter algarum (ex Zhang et al. 2020) TaxID=2578118 RepID=A0A5S3PRH4_9FLAO|nr:TonB-dependent receptor plug domain-containing protein [Maribacter algarum]TMM57347.1 hypothetical protein FEE95_12750 [Maribacter algarum]
MDTTLKTIRKIATFFFLGLLLTSFNRDEPKLDLVEKIYTHTDRPLYFPGETIWFKSYVMNRSNTISAISEMMYADLISPKGSVVKTLRLPVQNGYSYGDFFINKEWIGGVYTLKIYTNWMRNYGEELLFTKKITVQKVVQPKLLMKLKFVKEGYGRSSEVTADFEVKDLKNNPLSNTEVNLAVMIDGKSYLNKKLRTDAEGKLKPKFKLPDDLETTDVLLNMLIPHKGSTESISRNVPVFLENLDVQFFPESGKIIAGTSNTIAFKAINEYGKPADISGEVVDNEGNHILDFDSYHDGMGGFEFEPIAGKKYFAQITKPYVSDRQLNLPEVFEKGVRFSLKEENKTVALSLFSNTKEDLHLKISNSTGEIFSQPIASEDKNIKIATDEFLMGITKFTILGKKKRVLAERLIFLKQDEQLKIDIQIEKEIFNTREKVSVKIHTKDKTGTPVSSNISVAVADNKLLSFADDKQDHILSYLLMSSELKGEIHKPVFYFDKEESKGKKALDYVMLTHGWRDYIQEKEVSLYNAAYQPEQLAIQNGVVVDHKENPRKAQLLLFDNNDNKVLDFDTNDKGEFSFKMSKGSRFTLVAYTDDNAPLRIRPKRRADGFSSRPQNKKGIPNPDTPFDFYGVVKPNQKPINKEAKASLVLTEDTAQLDEVVVTAMGISRKRDATGSVTYIQSEELQTNESIAQTLQGKVAGVQITSSSGISGAATKINIRGHASVSGNNQPLFVVDGIPMDFKGQMTINPDQVNSISVLKDLAATTLYGSAGSNGVILISTKKANYNSFSKKKLNNKKYNNYVSYDFYNYNGNTLDRQAKFYVPLYEGEKLPEERTDFRSTIYWNPVVQTNAKGEAEFEFYNSDAITSFKISAEGVGHNGLLGRQEKDYSTKKLLNLDFKTPSYMTLNDIVVLPITIVNESDETLFSELQLDLPENLQLAETIDKNITIAAHSTVIRNVKVLVKKKGDDLKIRATIKSDKYQDLVHKKVSILSPYFPMQTAISGTKSQSFEFEVNNAVPNSLSAEFTLYTDITGDVMNGIASMMRQPYGCFEQVSSATYPNILILKYLQEKGKIRPRIERRAKKYIADGYRRMAAYETKENGFEWYGRTPPHEALSAYGLMQFKEMEGVYDGVDKKMIDRTINWLLSRRDNKGGFLQNKGKYGFSSGPKEVNNAYIVYALTETNTKVDLEKEYRTAYFHALDSLDTYKLALTALSSHNLKKVSDYENLMSYVKLNIRNHGFANIPVEHTITRSYGAAKNIETTAYVLLALLKDFESNELLIKEGIEHLFSRRSYGRFGSTQSTAMALKALIAYAKIQKSRIIGKDDTIEILLNGKIIKEKLQLNNSGNVKIDSLEKYIKDGKQTISIQFKNPKVTFPYDMNVRWDSDLPDTSENCKVDMQTEITPGNYKVADIVRMKVSVSNKREHGLPMTTAIVGIPSGTSVQPWQLKEILEQKKVAFYEIFDNYLVFYWREMGPAETKVINLDLKAEIAGNYVAPASSVYLYYGDEEKSWIKGNQLTISD